MDPEEETNSKTANPDASSSSSSSLLFINSTGSARGHPRDETTKRQIRQHVMRDIGKARRKPPRNPQVKLRVRSPTAAAGPSASSSSALVGLSEPSGNSQAAPLPALQFASQPRLPPPPRPFWDQHPLALMELNWGMDAFAAYGLALAVTWEKSFREPLTSRFWFPFAFKASDFCRNFLTGPEVRAAIHSQTKERSIAFALARSTEVMVCIESKLRDPDISTATDNSVIRAVMGCICYNYIVSDFDQARVHLNGLKLMIATRGGIESLADDQETLMMIFWVDTIGSLLFDQKPRFPMPASLIPPLPHEESPEILTTLAVNLSNLCPNPNAHHLGIVSAMRDIASLSETIQYKLATWGDELWKEEIYLGTRLNPIAYRLLDSPPHPHPDMPCNILEALRLGALLWILGVKQKAQAYPGSPATYVTRLLHLLQNQNMKTLVSTSPYFVPFQLWLLFLTAIMAVTADERAAALQIVAHMMNEYGWAWEQVVASVKQLPWISGFEPYDPALAAEVHLLRNTA
ncbi:hypothetical protein TARUN_733 [Trichoderma arundinaceum]|uniref:Uncharacterized protein n=1 Tax=Trichoderma arundinaceum TaxID=490622 RepID=A0A395NZE3_TRIAR|nr:hypothetical protein TARUN_733 [Trichoderma arundinaceum]